MKAYIKDIKSFKTLRMVECEGGNLADGENGSIVFYDSKSTEIQRVYTGAWCVVDGSLYYIAAVKPDHEKITFTLKNPLYAFDRAIEYTDEADTYGYLIAYYLRSQYIQGGGDTEYEMPYITVVNLDNTPYTLEPDGDGYFKLSEVIETARQNGVNIAFEVTGNRAQGLTVKIEPADLTPLRIIIGDGHNVLNSEDYDFNICSKVTVVYTQNDESKTKYTYYLSEDGEVSETPPLHRAKGRWETAFASGEEDPEEKARELFGDIRGHKIEFLSDRDIEYYRPLLLRLKNGVIETKVTAKSKPIGERWWHYKCGSMPITLIDKIKEIEK